MGEKSISGHYRVLIYDTKLGQFVYTVSGRLGMHVEVRDPERVIVMSRVKVPPRILGDGFSLVC